MTQALSGRAVQQSLQSSSPLINLVTVVNHPFSREALVKTVQSIQTQRLRRWQWQFISAPTTDSAVLHYLRQYQAHDARIEILGECPSRQANTDWLPQVKVHIGECLTPTALETWLWYQATHPEQTIPDDLSLQALLASVDDKLTRLQPKTYQPFAPISIEIPFQNPIPKLVGKCRVLMLLPWLAMGGADKFNLDLVEQLSDRGYEISICTTLPSDNPWHAAFARFTPDIFALPNFLRSPDFPRFLRYLIESRQIDIVFISNSYLGYRLLPFLRAFYSQVTFVDYNHMEEEWRSGNYARNGVAYQELLDLNIVSTHYLKQWMVERGAVVNRIEVCTTNIDPEQWKPNPELRSQVRRDLDMDAAEPLLLYAGRLVAQKRPRLFAEVIRRLVHEEKLKFRCLVAGDGPKLPFLKRFARRHELHAHVSFLGKVSLERMKALHAAADIFFLPSQQEGLSLALYEAMAMETVPVAADVGGQRELVTPECGYLIPQDEDEVDRYVAVLKHLIETPKQRAVMVKCGRKRIVEKFDLALMVTRMLQLLEKSQQLSQADPRPRVGKGLGLECATLAIHDTPLFQLTEIIGGLPSEEISRYMSFRKLLKVFFFKIGSYPRLRRIDQLREAAMDWWAK